MRNMKKIYYVCISVINGQLCSIKTEALNKIDAIFNFINIYDESPQEVFGPFSERRESSKRKLKNIKFSTNSYPATYNGWNVTVNELSHPNNYAFIMYDSPINKGTEKPREEVVHIRHIKAKYE